VKCSLAWTECEAVIVNGLIPLSSDNLKQGLKQTKSCNKKDTKAVPVTDKHFLQVQKVKVNL